MLRSLDIRDILIIDRLELQFEPGLNTLTGETGAGKSILLDSLGFVLGWRGRAELVRAGAEQGEVVACFDLDSEHPAHAVLEEAGIPSEPELILRRVNTPEGRKTAWINDRRASGEVLRRLSETLVELHGQQDDRGLLDIRTHRTLLDSFAELDLLVSDVRQKWNALGKARRACSEAETALSAIRDEEEFLRHAVAELEGLSPEAGESEQLDTRRRLMQAAEKLRADISRASEALGREGAEGAASDALRWLEDAAEAVEGQLDGAVSALGRALVELDEASREVESCLDVLSFNPSELEEVEERLFAIRGLARKHGVTPDGLAELTEELRTRLDRLEAGDDHLHALQAELKAAQSAYTETADALTQARIAGAQRLDQAVMGELGPLKMDRAQFITEISAEAAGPEGQDKVVFTVATNPGAPAGPLQKIASGGELSRFLLALKLCLAGDISGLTMIFDEIDRGVGGATADAVGRRLERLSMGGQIIVVTHSPQVAARAKHHWRVEKRVENEQTLSTVRKLSDTERVEEIARMISGDHVTDEARQASASLLDA